jgi:hypothetical protein
MNQLKGSPSIKVVALGRASIQLVEDLPIMHGVDYCQISGANFSWKDYVWSPASMNKAPFIKDISRIKFGLNAPVLENECAHVVNDLRDLDELSTLVQNGKQEIIMRLQGADMVLLVISLDCAMSYAASEIIAELSRDTGALTIAMIGAPYGCFLHEATHNVMNNLLSVVDSVITSEGIWACESDGRTKWCWGYETTAPKDLLWCATKSETDFKALKQLFTKSGRSVCGHGLGDSSVEAVNEALDQERFYWFDSCGKPATASSALVSVLADWQTIAHVMDEVKTTLCHNAPLAGTRKNYWHGVQQLHITAAEEESWMIGTTIFVNIISTGVAFE